MAGPTSQPGARGSRRRRVVREAHTGPRAKDLENIMPGWTHFCSQERMPGWDPSNPKRENLKNLAQGRNHMPRITIMFITASIY